MVSFSGLQESRQYWKKLSDSTGTPPTLHCFPLEYQWPRSKSAIDTADETSEALLRFCHRYNVGVYELIYGAWAIVSARHMTGDQQNTTFTVAGWHRSLFPTQEEINPADHDYPLILAVPEDMDVLSWIRHLGNANAEASFHAHIGYKQILEALSVDTPQTKISINGQRRDQDTINADAGYVIDLQILISDEFRISAHHNSSIPQAEVRILLEHFYTTLQQILKDQAAAIGNLQMMPATEMQLLRRYGEASQSPRSGLVHSLIEQQAELAPHAHAIQFERNDLLTFSALNVLSNQVAREIRAHGASVVPVHMYPSANFIVALLAILKAGAAYVILDPEAAAARRSYIIDDTRADVVLVDEASAGEYQKELNIEDLIKRSKNHSGSNLIIDQPDSDAAYIIYTSGSSGDPKGVELQHRAAFNGLHAFPRKAGLRQLLFYNPVFSAAQRSIWATLSVGGCLCLAARKNLTVHLAETINTMQINSIDMTSTTAALISPDQVPSLQRLVLGGEMVNSSVVQKWAHRVELFSAYGLSECTQLNWRCRLLKETNTRNIGWPSDTTTSYILTLGTTNLSPLLIPGELCLGGDQLARGYLNLSQQTEDRFIANPFGGGRLYRTGDMAIRHSDGSIELLGRIDFQVKINGQRIEPGEPNSIIQAHEQVENSVVVPAVVNQKVHLAAMIIRRDSSDGDDWNSLVERLRLLLRSRIPNYMVPSFWIPISALPLNANGKVNMAAVRDMVQELGDAGKLLQDRKRPAVDDTTLSINETIIRRLSGELLTIPEADISLDDSFISLGGTSLEAIQIVSKLRAEHGLVLQIEDVLLGSSLAHIAGSLKEQVGEVGLENVRNFNVSTVLRDSLSLIDVSIGEDEVEDAYGVTPFQEAAIADTIMGGENYIYSRFYYFNHHSMASIQEGLLVVAKSEALLRTTFVPSATSFIQIVKKSAEVPWEEILDMDVNGYLQHRATKPMRPGQLWWRVAALPGKILAITAHHALFDYWSNEFLSRDLTSILTGRQPVRRPLFRYYVEYLQAYDKAAMETFWREYLDGAKPMALGSYTGNEFTVTSRLQSNLRDTASSLGVTPSVLLYAAWALALATVGINANINATFDVVFGITISGRDAPISDILHMNGPTIMIAPLRVEVNPSKPFKELVNGVQDSLWKTARHAQYGLRNILKASKQGRGLVESMVNVLFKMDGGEKKEGLGEERGLVSLKEKSSGSVENVKLEFSTGAPDLVTLVSQLVPEFAKSLVDSVVDILDSATPNTHMRELSIERRRSEQQETSLKEVETTGDNDISSSRGKNGSKRVDIDGHSEDRLNEMGLMNRPPAKESLSAFHHGRLARVPSAFVKHEDIESHMSNGVNGDGNDGHAASKASVYCELAHSAFQRAAALYPGKVAVQDISGSYLTYAGLSIKVNRFAALLRRKGVVLDQVVPIMFEKSINTVVAIFGILVAGGAFLPLGPENPRQRNHGILEDLEGAIAVTDRSNAEFFDDAQYEVIVLDDLDWDTMPIERQMVPDLKPTNLAYVIYTSGSTGKPKGTLLSHEGVAVATKAINEVTQTDMQHRFLWVPNYTFDGSLDTLFTALSAGCTLCVAPQDEIAVNLTGLINTMEANRANMTPSMTALINPKEVPSLKVLLTGGEPLTQHVVSAWWSRVTIYNSYGPTEATISISTKQVEQGMNLRNVGQPYRSVVAMILDPDTMKSVRYGDVGELCVSGPQVARGYLKRPEATGQVFFEGPNGTTYRTGDLARFLPNGDIELFGRRDDQVKINGYRIELEEIESVARLTGLFVKCVVLAATVLKRKQLVALYTKSHETGDQVAHLGSGFLLRPEEAADVEQIKGQLSTIPTYMIPTIWLPVSKFPLSPAGKIDRKRLRTAVETMADSELKDYLPKQEESECITKSELTLRSAWSALFQTSVDDIHANSSFHALGGDSISALNLVSMLRRYGYDLKVSDIVSTTTLRQQARLVDASIESGASATAPQQLQYQPSRSVYEYLAGIGIPQDEVEDVYPCSPGQIEFLTQGKKQDQYWQLMAVRELPDDLDFDRWTVLTRRLTQENQILRALYLYTIKDDPQTAVQVVLKQPSLNITYKSFNTTAEKQQILDTEWETRFNPAKPFVRYTCLFDSKSGQRFLVVKLDHGSYDGTLLHIFDAQFKAFDKGMPIAKHTPFKHFIAHVLSQPKQPQLDYWAHLLANKTFTFPTMTSDPKITQTASARVNESLNIDTIATSTGVTSPIVFQTAFSLLLAHLSGSREVIYDNLVTGRNVALDNPQLINGNCANFLPFYSCVEAEKPMAELLKETQSAFWTATENGFVSLGEIYSSLGKERSVAAAKCLFCFQPFEPVTGEQDSMRWIVMKMSQVRMCFNYAVQLEILKGVKKGEYVIRFGYDGTAFTKEQVELALEWYVRCLERMCKGGVVKDYEV
ncbi:putative nonribosomal peptide synthase [Decorospora gaudefroyi]|uniref:Putative nonribosomal peptide synthase n=1 Tax=Decorospora gaudefroyi TaxID=184978 RepID=A0A6A5KK06_9PLEO|nr:putative nonribosomal peptide synthase [Decorospora gaudefroyi]